MFAKVLNFGSLNIDYVYRVNHILLPGETLSSSSMNTFCGGKGLNQSIAIAKAGMTPYHAGMVGEDGNILLEYLKDNGSNIKYIKTTSGKSGHTIIQVDSKGQNCIIVYAGANRCQSKSHIDTVLQDFKEGDYLLLQNEMNEIGYIIKEAYHKGMKVIMNPSPVDDHLLECDLDKVYLFLINEIEGEALTGCKKPLNILEGMKTRYPNAKVLLTLGDKGAYYMSGDEIHFQEVISTTVVDTTAAGDTFTGYFLAGLVGHLPIDTNLYRSAKAASIAVSREGAAQSIPGLDEVMKG